MIELILLGAMAYVALGMCAALLHGAGQYDERRMAAAWLLEDIAVRHAAIQRINADTEALLDVRMHELLMIETRQWQLSKLYKG